MIPACSPFGQARTEARSLPHPDPPGQARKALMIAAAGSSRPACPTPRPADQVSFQGPGSGSRMRLPR